MDIRTLQAWVNINSGTGHAEGLRLMADALSAVLAGLPGELERISLPPVTALDGSLLRTGDALRFRFNREAPVQVLFSGHMDTVYGKDHPFQSWREEEPGRVRGPGVADMKGGLFILIEAVSQFLGEPGSGALGGEILITSDEEIGSPGSRELLVEAAAGNHLGLVFESALPGGELVSRRKGTGVFRVTASGQSAHTGRDFAQGRNAIVALASFALECHQFNATYPDAIVNLGRLSGGGAVNVVPDQAEAWLNIRMGKTETVGQIEAALRDLLQKTEARWEGVRLGLSGGFSRPPKEESPADARLHALWNQAEGSLGLPGSGKRETGGSSDGNIFAQVGLPHLDGVGIRGGAIHSENEFALLDSIPAQIDKTVAFLKLLASQPGLLQEPPFSHL